MMSSLINMLRGVSTNMSETIISGDVPYARCKLCSTDFIAIR